MKTEKIIILTTLIGQVTVNLNRICVLSETEMNHTIGGCSDTPWDPTSAPDNGSSSPY